jgi:hypothetical protein
MWFFKLILLLTLIASWIPKDGKAQVYSSHSISVDMESEEQEEDEGGEEAAA